MKNEVTGKEMITKFLDRVTITARVGVETGEFTKEEILDYITQYGNKRIIKLLEMSEEKFAMVAVMELVRTGMEIKEMERGEENDEITD